MKLLRIFAFSLGIFLLTAFASTAEAQVSAYVIGGLSAYGFSYQGDTGFKDNTGSFGGGAFYNFPIHSRLTAGIDGRVLYGPASYGGITADAALRVGFVPTRVRLRPYFEIGGGVVSSVFYPGVEPQRITNGAAEFLGGLDIRLTDSVDLRAVELGGTAGVSNNNRTSEVSFLNAGFVYHFHPAPPASQPKP